MKRLRRHSPSLALAIITLIGLIGFVDRIVVNALVEPLKAEFGLSDAQIGTLGFAYSALNIVLGVVVARMAESRRRLTFTAVGTLLWSIAATACGFVNGWYQLLAARIAVGVGEAVGLPANQSLIADYYPPNRRATAMSVLLLAAPLGAFVGLAGGGYIAQIWGWRWAFIVTGLPGILLAAIVWMFLQEPERGAHDALKDEQVPPIGTVIKRFVILPSARHLLIGSSLGSMVGFGMIAFLSALISRRPARAPPARLLRAGPGGRAAAGRAALSPGLHAQRFRAVRRLHQPRRARPVRLPRGDGRNTSEHDGIADAGDRQRAHEHLGRPHRRARPGTDRTAERPAGGDRAAVGRRPGLRDVRRRAAVAMGGRTLLLRRADRGDRPRRGARGDVLGRVVFVQELLRLGQEALHVLVAAEVVIP
jgi:MFS family permease